MVFISHSSADRDIADYIARDLAAQGIEVWSDRSILPGEAWDSAITKALDEAQFFVLVLSPRSLSSEWVNFEAGVALSRDPSSGHRRVLPILVKGADRNALPIALRGLQAVEMEGGGIAEATRKVAEAITKSAEKEEENG